MTINAGITHCYNTRILQWTSSDADNNSTGASWYGLQLYKGSDGYNWISFSNYWGINLIARSNDYIKINGNTIITSSNISSQSVSYAGSLTGMTRNSSSNWSSTGLSMIMGMSDGYGGDCLFLTNQSGQMSFEVDGCFYQRRDSGGSFRCLDTGDLSGLNSSFFKYEGYWNGTYNVDNAKGMKFVYSGDGAPFSWGVLATFEPTESAGYKLQIGSNGYWNGGLYYRNRSSDRGGWTNWCQIIDSDIIGSQSVNYASSAGSVSWSNVTAGTNSNGNFLLSQGNYFACGIPGNGGTSASASYISAGPGFSPSSGRYGVRVLSCDQSDCQSGIGQDLSGKPYDMCVAACSGSGSYSYISFVSHPVNSTSYTCMGYFTYSTSGHSLTINGNAYASSDRHLKKSISSISASSLERLFSVSDKLLKKFTWKQSGKVSYGFIAQELEQYIPEAISENPSTKIKNVSYNIAYAKIIASLIHKIKSLESKVDELSKLVGK